MANLNWFADEGGEQPVEVNYTFKDVHLRLRGQDARAVRLRRSTNGSRREGIEIVAFAPSNNQDDAPEWRRQ